MKGYKELGNKYLKYRKKRSCLVAASMVLATVLIYTVLTLVLNYWFDLKAITEEHMNYHVEFMNLDKEKQEKIKNYATVQSVDFIYVDLEQRLTDCYGTNELELRYVESMEQNVFGYKLIDGELPKDSTEIILHKDNLYSFNENVEIGDQISTVYWDDAGNEIPANTFTVVGVFENEVANPYTYGAKAFTIAPPDMELSAYVKYDNFADWEAYSKTLAEDIGLGTGKTGVYEINSSMGLFYFKGDSAPLIAMFLMLMVFVVYVCMVMIRSLFSANLIDNLREFNILKAMGATDRHIKAIFRREIYLEGGIAFVAGILISNIGYFILRRGFKLYGFNFDFSVFALLFVMGFMVLTIELAIIEPLGILKKVPVVEGIKANYAYVKNREKRRSGKFFRMFGIEGEYAYKNMRRNSRSFWGSVASFTISVLIMTVLVTALANLKEQINLTSGSIGPEEQYDYYTIMPGIEIDEEKVINYKNAIENLDYVSSVSPYYNIFFWGYQEENIVTGPDGRNDDVKEDKDSYGSSDGLQLNLATLYLYTDEQLERLNGYMLDEVDAGSIRDGGVILVNGYGECYEESGRGLCEKTVSFKEKPGDKIKVINPAYAAKAQAEGTYLKNIKENTKNESLYEDIEIKGLCERTLLNEPGVILIMSYSYVKENYPSDFYSSVCGGYYIDVDEGIFEITDMATLEQVIYKDAKQMEYDFFDMAKWMNEQTKSARVIVICIVIFIIAMGVISILNNMVNEQQIRRKEVSILRSIGMSKKKLNRMLILEKLIIGILAWIIGTVLGFVFSRTLLIVVLYIYEETMVIPWLQYLGIGAVVIAIMVLLSMIMVKSMGKMDITEGIRNQE